MAEVHLAEDAVTKGRVAIKRMLPHQVQDPELRARFKAEAELLEQLNHPNIVRLIDRSEDQLVLEYLEGPSLQGLYGAAKQKDGVPSEVSVRIAAELLSALGYAHGAMTKKGRPLGVVHRDVTPSNLLFGKGGRPVLIDFGVAYSGERPPLTKTGVVIGKVGYLAPEVARGEGADKRADLFSVGAILFELLCGAPAFSGRTIGDVMNRVASGGYDDPRAHNPSLTDQQRAFLVRSIACAPEARFDDAFEMSAELHDVFASTTEEVLRAFVESLFAGTTGQPTRGRGLEDKTRSDTIDIPAQEPEPVADRAPPKTVTEVARVTRTMSSRFEPD